MRKLAILSVLSVMVVSMAGGASAEGVKFGIGVPIAKEVLMEGGWKYYLGGTNVTVPILFEAFKLEPEFGIYRISGGDDFTMQELRFGIGGAYTISKEDVNIYLGFNFGMAMVSWDEGDDSETLTDMYFGPTIGGEYFFTEHFALGGEAHFEFTTYDEDWGEVDSSFINKNYAFIRFYF